MREFAGAAPRDALRASRLLKASLSEMNVGSSAVLVERINGVRDQIGPVDEVLVSGDLSDDGSAESYVRFKTLVAPLELPTYVIPGNHDASDPMRTAFAGCLPVNGPLNWHHKVGDIHLIGLDTLVEGRGLGTLSSDSLSFLRDTLSVAAGAQVLLAMHHPPFHCGIGFMDDIGLTNRDALRDLVADYSGILRVVCGHIHNLIVSNIAEHITISSPSPCSSFAYNRRPDAPVGYMTQADGCLLHLWDGGFQTIRIGPVAGSGPFPF